MNIEVKMTKAGFATVLIEGGDDKSERRYDLKPGESWKFRLETPAPVVTVASASYTPDRSK